MKWSRHLAWLLPAWAALVCLAQETGLDAGEIRAVLKDVLDTEYCGTAVQNGLGMNTAIRGLSPVPGRGFVCIEETDWGPVLLEMAEAELERCKKDTIAALADYRRAQKVFVDNLPLLKTPEARGNASAPVVEARRKLDNETRRLHKMVSLLGLMDGEREEVVRLIGRIAKECPIEFNLHREANGAWIGQTMKDGDVEKCLELGRWYRAHKGKGSEEEIDFCRQAVAEVLHNCTSQEQYDKVARYVLEAMDECGNYPQCNQFDAVATERLRGWVGSVQRRRMAERFLDWQPFRLSHINQETGDVEYEDPTPEAVAQLLRSRAAAELAADEKDLTDLRAVYGSWEEEGSTALGGTDHAMAAENQVGALHLDGFALRVKELGVSPVSMTFAQEDGDPQKPEDNRLGTLDWGRQMLAELERAVSDPSIQPFERVQDILAFRDWCLGASGGGNLALAISAEEVAMTLLFRELAKDNGNADRVRAALRQCQQNNITAKYWSATLAVEGLDAEAQAPLDPDAAEYRQMESVFSFVRQNCAGSDAGALFPKTIWPREGCLDEFNSYALMWRSAMLERKEIALEACLAIQDALANIPEESESFRNAADRYAGWILDKRERLTSWMTAHSAWDYWEEALKAVRPAGEE